MYREGSIADRTARDWFAKFKNRNFELKDAARSRLEFDEERLNQFFHEDARQTTRVLTGTNGL